MNLQRLLATVCISLGTLAGGVPHALAQGGALPAAVIESSDLTPEQKEAVKQYVDAHKEGLKAGPLEIKKSRNALLEPMKDQKISVAFRLEYTRQLSPFLRSLLADKSEVIAVNALRVAGELATAGSVDLLVEALKDKRPGVRYSAASGYENTFKAMQGTVPALGGAQALKMVDTVKGALQAETNPRVLEGLVLALQEASKIPTKQVEGMRDASVRALAEAISAKTADRKIGSDADPALRRAVLAIRTAVTNRNINEPDLQKQTLRAAAGMSGDLLALVMERSKSGGFGADADLALMVNEAEKAIYFIQPLLAANPPPKEFKVSELVQQGKGEEYQKQVLQIIGPNGVLTDTIFGFPDDHFIKPR